MCQLHDRPSNKKVSRLCGKKPFKPPYINIKEIEGQVARPKLNIAQWSTFALASPAAGIRYRGFQKSFMELTVDATEA